MKVYVCVTLYHAYITMLMISAEGNDKEKNVVLLNANNPEVYKQYEYIHKQLKKNGYISAVRLRKGRNDFWGEERAKNLEQLAFVKKACKAVGEDQYTLVNFAWNNSYVYPSVNLLYKNCQSAIFVEESTLIAKLGKESMLKVLYHRIMGNSVDFYKDSKLSEIVVQKPETFPDEWQHKLKRLIIDEYVERLSEADKDAILRILSNESADLLKLRDQTDAGIIYTCPFSEQNVISEDEKKAQNEAICNYYQRYGSVILKLHPRDLSDYSFIPNITIISGRFPSELLALAGIKFKFAVSVCSSAVNTTNADYKVNFNENFYNDPKFELKDIYGNVVKD